MGLDFSALIRYPGPSGDVLQSIARLERGDKVPALDEVVACGLRSDFNFAKSGPASPSWHQLGDWERALAERASLPSLDTYLDLPSGFSLTFGRDAVWVYHLLRWMFFCSEAEWQRVMLAAVQWFCELLTASECIVTRDEHPAVLAFRRGVSFEEAIRGAAEQGEGPVAKLEDLYIDAGYAEDLVYLGENGEEIAIPLWDTHGYWRLDLEH